MTKLQIQQIIISFRQINTILRQKYKAMYQSKIFNKSYAGSNKKMKDSTAVSWGSHQLDFEYLQTRDEILRSQFYQTLQKQAKIRLNGWISKLDSIIANQLWKKNRNTYAKLINLMCQCQVFVQPFTALPPQSDISTLSKHEVNSIIDQVELAVKKNTVKTSSWLKEQLKTENIQKETPKEYWSRVRQQRSKAKLNGSQDSSISIEKVIAFASKKSQKRFRQLSESMSSSQASIKSLPLRVINLSIMQKQNIKPQSIQSSDYQSQKQFKKTNVAKLVSIRKNLQNTQLQLKLQPAENNLSSLFSKNKRIATNYTGVSDNQQPPLNFRDQHQSIQLADDTLKTEPFYSQSYESTHQDPSLKVNQSHLTDCNFSDQFSQRCKTKQEVLTKNYFSWKKPTQIFDTKPLAQIQLKPMEPLSLRSQREEPSSSVETLLENVFESNIVQKSKAISSNKSHQRHYWQSDSISSDFLYREGETIKINECQQNEMGEQGRKSTSKMQISA